MLNITLICVGGLKEAFWKAACAEYSKRIGLWAKVTVVEIPETRLPESPSRAVIDAALEKEAEKIRARLPGNTCVTALCVEGGQLSSPEFAQEIGRRMMINGNLSFIIGGSYGLAQSLKDGADIRLSLSHMTFPHMAARVLLLEQIYRALNLLNGGKYHK